MSEHVNAGFSIRGAFRDLQYTTLARIAQDPSSLAMIRAAAHHPDVVQGVMSEEIAETARAQIAAANRGRELKPGERVGSIFARGKIMKHVPSGHRVTIIEAYSGKKNGEKLHTVTDQKTGKKFLAKESNLRPVMN
jgi:hypothetical protein